MSADRLAILRVGPCSLIRVRRSGEPIPPPVRLPPVVRPLPGGRIYVYAGQVAELRDALDTAWRAMTAAWGAEDGGGRGGPPTDVTTAAPGPDDDPDRAAN